MDSSYLARLCQSFRFEQLKRDSRKIVPGDLFVALPGVSQHGANHAHEAILAGAKGVLSDRPRPSGIPDSIEWIFSPSAEADFSALANRLAGNPLAHMVLIGVTGTNGKSTVAEGIAHGLQECGRAFGAMGTVAHHFRDERWESEHTTPDLLTFLGILRDMKRAGAEGVVLEVSSHALAQERLKGAVFSGAVFTNLTRDHLDYHGDMAHYFREKARLFAAPILASHGFAVINCDSPYGDALYRDSQGQVRIGYGLESGHAELKGKLARLDLSGLLLDMELKGETVRLESPLIGVHNAANLLAMVGALVAMGIPLKKAARALESYAGVRGRLERVTPRSADRTVLVDYAHTPDALHWVLQSLRGLRSPGGKLGVVLGCGGNRDRGKRPLMGREVAALADWAVVTSDNPRGEDPEAIIAEIMAGVPKEKLDHFHIEVDRRRAIDLAVSRLNPGDILLVAGKGHETVQVFRDSTVPFDDCAVAREALRL